MSVHGTSNIDWIDNRVVTVASCLIKHESLIKALNVIVRVKKARTDVPQPHLIEKCNSDMRELISLTAT